MAGLITKAQRGRSKQKNANIGPTPETAAKLKPDQLAVLLGQGKITPDHERGRPAPAQLHAALKKGASPTTQLRLPSTLRGHQKPLSPLEHLNEGQQRQWNLAYRPWADSIAQKIVGRRPKLSLLGLVRRVVDDNHSIQRVSFDFNLPEGDLLNNLRDGLEAYIAQK